MTDARAAFVWLAAGSVTVQQQALRDFAQAKANFFRGTHGRPTWRKAGRDEGFRQIHVKPEHIQRLNRRHGRVWVPKVGWVRFRWSRPVPDGIRSYRVTCDRAGRWHVAFAVVPNPIPAPGNGEVVGVDRGVIARLTARQTDRRRDWVEKTSTDLAGRFDVIRVEDLTILSMTRSARGTVDRPGRNVRQKAGLNRGILANAWGQFVTRLEHKAPGRVEKINAANREPQPAASAT